MCREFDPEFATVAQSWKKAHPKSDGVFFAKLDFAEGRPIFMRVLSPSYDFINASLGFNLRLMFGFILLLLDLCPNYHRIINPSFMIFLASTSLIAKVPNHSGMHAEPFHRFLQANIKLPEFSLVRPFNWQKLFVTIVLAVIFGTIIKIAWPKVKKIVNDRHTWAMISLVYRIPAKG